MSYTSNIGSASNGVEPPTSSLRWIKTRFKFSLDSIPVFSYQQRNYSWSHCGDLFLIFLPSFPLCLRCCRLPTDDQLVHWPLWPEYDHGLSGEQNASERNGHRSCALRSEAVFGGAEGTRVQVEAALGFVGFNWLFLFVCFAGVHHVLISTQLITKTAYLWQTVYLPTRSAIEPTLIALP